LNYFARQDLAYFPDFGIIIMIDFFNFVEKYPCFVILLVRW